MQEGSEPVRRQSFSAPLLALRRGDQLLLTEGSALACYLEAQDLARRLGKPLWQVDLAAVTSRYIGATERNLRRLFEAAERAGAILFFDEADALFGKRTEVKDAHDRYAAQLARRLQRAIAGYGGPVILVGCGKAKPRLR